MTNHLLHDLQQLGYLARAYELRQLGHTASSIDREIRSGRILRPVRAWLASTDARRDAVIAVAHRGVLTNSSPLDSNGIWRGTDAHIHVQLPPNSPGGVSILHANLADFAPNRIISSGVARHWGTTQVPASGWRVSVVDALVSFATTQTPEYLVAAIDSALHTGALSPSLLPWIEKSLPSRLRSVFALIDGRAEAGTETLARLGLGLLGRQVAIQVTVGPHRLDILIDGWLNIEIDSEEWHGADRLRFSRRDTWLGGRGYFVLRFDYAEVMFGWDTCLAAIRMALSVGPPRARR